MESFLLEKFKLTAEELLTISVLLYLEHGLPQAHDGRTRVGPGGHDLTLAVKTEEERITVNILLLFFYISLCLLIN